MKTVTFKGKTMGLLGFGAMRLPTLEDKSIDEKLFGEMVDYCMEQGVNYFDTAYPYHEGKSEIALGKALSKYPRESFFLANKYPGHQILSTGYNPSEIFEEQLKKCGVEYFDFYLLHNVYEKSMETYLDPRWDIIGYFREQKRLGRIRHLGFSSHAELEALRRFLDICGEDMEFCQIQLNWLDWTLQRAKEKYELLTERRIPVWVMEPVRGGRLAKLKEEDEKTLKDMRPGESIASWSFRWLKVLPNVKMILSGMSNMEQLRDNVKTFSVDAPLSDEETELLMKIAVGMLDNIPCTNCRYCCDGCPMGLDIPGFISACNELRFFPTTNVSMRFEFMEEDKKPSACINCGACTDICPQKIDIPEVLRDLTERLGKLPSWVEVSRKREEAAKIAR
ncbi:MAG: oxidoreductase [Clostridiales bacterium]|nr:oxidoreductase [Clostridiales bacterium]